MAKLCCAVALWLLTQTSYASADELPRIGFFGARVMASGKHGEGATVARVIKDSEAERIGLTTSDRILSLNGHAVDTDSDVENFFYRPPSNTPLKLEILREGKRLEVQTKLAELQRESFPGVQYIYDSVRNNKGQLLRTIVTRPVAGSPKLPTVLVVAWLSCDSCEYPFAPGSGMDKLLAHLVKESGFAVVRMDKPGVGDSQGVCSEADFLSEMSGFQAAFKSMEKYPFIDRERVAVVGMSNGGGFAPLVAPPDMVKGYVAISSWGRTWYEHMLAIERQRRVASGAEPGKINSDLKKVSEFYQLYLNGRETPKQILAAHPEWKDIWNDGEATQYGRPAAFYRQLQQLNLGELWTNVKAPVLVVHGEYDWIMPREDAVAIVDSVTRAGRPGKYVELPRVSHTLSQFDSLKATTADSGGEYYKPVEAIVTDFLRTALK